ncbi:MAG TPA: hypothetical protein VEI97_13480 [bacterium]|nr:hypothetical protein [bacterium]
MNRRFWIPLAATLLAYGCAGNPAVPADSPTPALPQGQAALGEAITVGNATEMPLALYTIKLNTSGMTASVEPKQVRTVSAAGADTYELCVNNFFPSPPMRITRLTIFGDAFRMHYSISHPFAAPSSLDAPASASNRADLGISGACLYLADASTSGGTPVASSFFGGETVCNPNLVSNAHGYYNPGDMLSLSGFACNTFPYRCLVDETDPECRTSTKTGNFIPSSSNTGNYDAASDGWQRSNIGANNDGWTGYGVLHQGQTASSFVDLDMDGLEDYQTASGGFSMDMAIIATYNDPRGGTTATEKKRNRLPSSDGNADNFFYDMPKGACPIERVHLPEQTWDLISAGPVTAMAQCASWTGGGDSLTCTMDSPPVFDSPVEFIPEASGGDGTPSSPFIFLDDIRSRVSSSSNAGDHLVCVRVSTTVAPTVLLDCDLAPASATTHKKEYVGHVTLLK